MTTALAGLRIIDATNYVFGPLATQMLGDMGAEIIKIEPPAGDPSRQIGQHQSTLMGSFFLNLNRNKKSVVLNLKKKEGLDALKKLLGSADVFVHNMRHSAATKLGISYPQLTKEFPALIYASAQGFSKAGRYFDQPAFDDVIQGLSGLTGLQQTSSGQANYAPMLLTDKLCGVFLAYAISIALIHRERTGQAQEVQVPMFESMVAFNLHEHLADAVFNTPQSATHLGYARALNPWHRPLKTADGYLCLIANTDQQWQRLLTITHQKELINDPMFATITSRMQHIDTIYKLVESALQQQPTAHWLTVCKQADLPVAPVNSLSDVRTDPHLQDIGFFVEQNHPSEGPLLYPSIPFDFSESPGQLNLPPPLLGQHNLEVLGSLGFSSAEINHLTI